MLWKANNIDSQPSKYYIFVPKMLEHILSSFGGMAPLSFVVIEVQSWWFKLVG